MTTRNADKRPHTLIKRICFAIILLALTLSVFVLPNIVVLSASNGDTRLIIIFLRLGFHPDCFKYNGSMTALSLAAARRKSSVAKLLVKHGADPRDSIIYVSRKGFMDVLQAMDSVITINLLTSSGERVLDQALIEAAEQHHPVICEYLIRKGANVNYVRKQDQSTPLSACLDSNAYGVNERSKATTVRLLIANGAKDKRRQVPSG